MVLALLALLDNNELKVWQMFSHLLNENNSSFLTWLLVGSKLGDISEHLVTCEELHSC